MTCNNLYDLISVLIVLPLKDMTAKVLYRVLSFTQRFSTGVPKDRIHQNFPESFHILLENNNLIGTIIELALDICSDEEMIDLPSRNVPSFINVIIQGIRNKSDMSTLKRYFKFVTYKQPLINILSSSYRFLAKNSGYSWEHFKRYQILEKLELTSHLPSDKSKRIEFLSDSTLTADMLEEVKDEFSDIFNWTPDFVNCAFFNRIRTRKAIKVLAKLEVDPSQINDPAISILTLAALRDQTIAFLQKWDTKVRFDRLQSVLTDIDAGNFIQ